MSPHCTDSIPSAITETPIRTPIRTPNRIPIRTPIRMPRPLLVLSAVMMVLFLRPAQAQETSADLAYRVYLIGDTGGANAPGTLPALNELARRLQSEGENTAVVFLGDNIYCCGLPDSAAESRARAEMRLDEALNAVEGFAGRTILIPGNHDWGEHGEYDARILLNQQRYVEERLGEGSFLPQFGLPGPFEVKLTDDIRLIAIDTQWWMMEDKPFGESDDYDIGEDGDFLMAVRDLLARRDDEQVLMVGHHPLVSYGTHGGRFPVQDHIFPLRELDERLWIPLPGLGSFYPLLRAVGGFEQDLSNRRYTELRESLLALFAAHEGNLIYASGHEHTLQHIIEGQTHLLVSGSASRPDWVSASRAPAFASASPGFMVVDYHQSGRVVMRAIDATGTELYRSELFAARPGAGSDDDGGRVEARPALVDSVTVAASPILKAGKLKRALLGSHHRDAWVTPVTVPVFDVTKVKGGLTPIKRGGGMQTISLRLQDGDGYQYVLRSIDKDPSKTIPLELQETIARDIVRDQNAIIMPYGALMVPPLATAAGIFHASPRVVYIPDDPALGVHAEELAGQLMLFEERPDDDMSDFEQFGASDDVISSGKMYRELLDDNDNRVDARFYMRSRLFDMFLSDWDRHADQWRWASYEDPDGKGDLYRPIPRDRDWAFNRMNGFFPTIIKNPNIEPKFQDFRPRFGFIPGLNRSGEPLDRRFTISMSREDWVAEAEDIARSISRADMDAAVAELPDEVRSLYDGSFQDIMASRLEELPEVAAFYHDFLLRLVDVVGSDKHERFTVQAWEDSVRVTMTKTTKEGEPRHDLLERTFHADETEEIRLYGMDGTDRFILSGTARTRIRIYALGGTGDDEYTDLTRDESTSKHWFVMDTNEIWDVGLGASTRMQPAYLPNVILYDESRYWTEAPMPILDIGSSQEDGLVLGGGLTYTSYVFHRNPFSTMHRIFASVGMRSKAFTFHYDLTMNQRLGAWGFFFSGNARTQGNIENFYGFGSDTRRPVDSTTFYETEIEDYSGDLGILRQMGEGVELRLSTMLEHTDVDEAAGGFALTPGSGADADDFERQVHGGFGVQLIADRRDNPVYPHAGYVLSAGARTRIGINSNAEHFTTWTGSLALYWTPAPLDRTTFAMRSGGTRVVGDFPYFRSATVGSTTGLRGWRRDRFSGHTSWYQNVEVRQELFTFATILAVGSAGVLAHVDNGRVWSEGEDNGQWHQGVGGGVWANLFGMAVFNVSATFSEEETYVGFGLSLDY